ncbi:lipid A biosynthesis lauroyl acyltransferase [Pararhizobium sp. BT-229]|uniref:lysophospholipid acyltransferase family protein n=1 Tax=Pararhizobium sp. BT-229 TaxID=2986923 RepID=UPI0021F74D2A|nr:lipid A biosynthesis lauroyl acyltransferase [Pararhizobium sp. BT-229]MCV9963066.1 lipid A biosynthesis lauroyl acyltransferase [Pararhizobium sp. BT-229]
MRTKPSDPTLATRKAFVWQEETPPRLADLIAGGEARSRFLRYWVRDQFYDLPKMLSYHMLKLLPSGIVSELGALHYQVIGRFHKGRNTRIGANAARIRPDLDPATVTRLNWRSRGRLMSEFSVLPRLVPAGRVRVEGAENLTRARAEGPVIILGVHLSNWELLFAVLQQMSVPFCLFYMPPESRAEHRIARKVRQSIGATLLPPGVKGVRPAMKMLGNREGVVMLFGDEGFDGRIMAPFFGRPPHLSGNLAIAIRLARHSGALIVPAYVIRRRGAHFTCRWLPPIRPAETDDPGATLAGDVERLNAVIEPIIRKYVSQWHFLDHKL